MSLTSIPDQAHVQLRVQIAEPRVTGLDRRLLLFRTGRVSAARRRRCRHPIERGLQPLRPIPDRLSTDPDSLTVVECGVRPAVRQVQRLAGPLQPDNVSGGCQPQPGPTACRCSNVIIIVVNVSRPAPAHLDASDRLPGLRQRRNDRLERRDLQGGVGGSLENAMAGSHCNRKDRSGLMPQRTAAHVVCVGIQRIDLCCDLCRHGSRGVEPPLLGTVHDRNPGFAVSVEPCKDERGAVLSATR